MQRPWLSAGAVALAILALTARAGRAESDSGSNAELRREVRALERRVQELEHERDAGRSHDDKVNQLEQQVKQVDSKVDAQQAEVKKVDARVAADQAKVASLPKIKAGRQGFSLGSDDGDFSLRIRGYVQADSHEFTTGSKPASGSTFEMRRVRPILEGTVFRFFDYKIMPDFGLGTSVLQDAYLDAHYYDPVRLDFG